MYNSKYVAKKVYISNMRKRINSVVRTIVRDIIYIFKKHKNGEFELPEDLPTEDLVYDFDKLPTSLTISLSLIQDDTINTTDINGEYYVGDDVIVLIIITNPKKENTLIYELIGELNEIVRHELEHLIQDYSGYIFPDEEPDEPKEYYTQKHELKALRKGFKRKSKVMRKDYEFLIREWFEKNKHKHTLSQEETKFVIDKILLELPD